MQGEKFSGLLTFLGYSKVLCAQQNFWSTEKFSYHPNFTVCQKFLDCYDFFECFKKFASPKNFSKQSILRCKMLGVPKNFTFRESLIPRIIHRSSTNISNFEENLNFIESLERCSEQSLEKEVFLVNLRM